MPIHAWYEQCSEPAEIRARIAAIATTLEPANKVTTEAWMLSTRIVQRRALRVVDKEAPIRKFALQLRVEPVSGYGASGHTTVTAFLRPGAQLREVWALPGDMAIARVTLYRHPERPRTGQRHDGFADGVAFTSRGVSGSPAVHLLVTVG